ncbi:MAG: O-antigen ligase family protein [Bacillota bacterium]
MKNLLKRIRAINTVEELLDNITPHHLRKASKWLLFILVVSPLYAMFRSLFFENHTSEAYFGNLLAVGRVWQLLIRQLGYLGLIVGSILIAKAVLKKRRLAQSNSAFVRAHVVEILLGGFLVLAFLSTLFSTNVSLSWNGAFYRREGFEMYLAYAGLFAMALTQNKKSGLFLLYAFIGTAFILTLFSFIDSAYLNEWLTLTATSSIFHNANHYGYYLLMALMANFAVLMHLRRKKIECVVGFLLSFALITHTVITNRTFGVFFALTLGLVVSLSIIFWLKRTYFKRALFLGLLFVGVSIVSSVPTGYLQDEGETLSEDVGSVVSGEEGSENAGSGRWSLWVHGIEFAGERPILGYGPDNLGQRYQETGHNTDRPHNEIIQFSASLGLPAALLYISAIIALAVLAFKERTALTLETLTVGFAVIAYLISSMFGNTMFYTTPFYVLLLGLTTHFIKIDMHALENSQGS